MPRNAYVPVPLLKSEVKYSSGRIWELTVKGRDYGFEPDEFYGISYGCCTRDGNVPWMEGSAIDMALKWYQKDTLRIINNRDYITSGDLFEHEHSSLYHR